MKKSQENTEWYLEDAKQDVMIYADVRGIDFGLRKQIKQDYLPVIKEHKMKPLMPVNNYKEIQIICIGLLAMLLLVPSLRLTDPKALAIIFTMLILYIVSVTSRYRG